MKAACAIRFEHLSRRSAHQLEAPDESRSMSLPMHARKERVARACVPIVDAPHCSAQPHCAHVSRSWIAVLPDASSMLLGGSEVCDPV